MSSAASCWAGCLAKVVYEDEQTLGFLDIAPAMRGHTLVAPKLHVADLLAARLTDRFPTVSGLPPTLRVPHIGGGADCTLSISPPGAADESGWPQSVPLKNSSVPRSPAPDGQQGRGRRLGGVRAGTGG